MTNIQQEDATENNNDKPIEKIYEDEQYIINDEGQVVVAGSEDETSEESKKDAKTKLPEIHISEVATVTCQQDLDKILAEHLEWTEAVLNPKLDSAKGRANLKGADLRPYDLSGKNLSGANLSGANLQGVELLNANLTATNLEGADLRCANLRGAKMVRTKVSGADLRAVDLTDAILIGVDLTTAVMRSPEPGVAAEVATNGGTLFNNDETDESGDHCIETAEMHRSAAEPEADTNTSDTTTDESDIMNSDFETAAREDLIDQHATSIEQET